MRDVAEIARARDDGREWWWARGCVGTRYYGKG
jgi:hypothetical protein